MEGSARGFIHGAIGTILDEILHGSAAGSGWILNPGDIGLLKSLDRISAEEASNLLPNGTSSTASHVDHLRYGLSLLNQTVGGDNPFEGADWSAAWRTVRVSESEWTALREGLKAEAEKWRSNHGELLDAGQMELTGVLASVAHLAYHLGSIRQISPSTRGPADGG